MRHTETVGGVGGPGGGTRLPRVAGAGFSLVELLAVVGIISVLVALLLPAVSRVREQSHQVACLSNLRNIGMAAQLHVNDHGGFLPCAGWQFLCVDGVCNPHGLEDDSERKYDYYVDDGVKRPLPTSVALAYFLGVRCRTDSRENLEHDMEGEPLRRLFRCPSQQVERRGWTQRGDEGGSWIAPAEYSSYAFNEALLGRRRYNLAGCPKGQLSRVKEPTRVMFAADARPRDEQSNQYLLVPDGEDEQMLRATLYDVQHALLASEPNKGREGLDFARHGGRINAVFCDWHAESFPMGVPPEGGGGLKEIYVSRGIAN